MYVRPPPIANGDAIGSNYNDSSCLDFVGTFDADNHCELASVNGLTYFTDTQCTGQAGVGYYATEFFDTFGCRGAPLQTIGYTVGLCIPFGERESMIYDCTGEGVIL